MATRNPFPSTTQILRRSLTTNAGLFPGSSPVRQQSSVFGLIGHQSSPKPRASTKGAPLLNLQSISEFGRISSTKLPTLGARASSKIVGAAAEEARIHSRDRTVSYIETLGERRVKHVMNFDSPRTLKAAAQLGVTIEDCIKKPYTSFCRPGVPEKIAQLRHAYQVNRVQDTVEKLYMLRKELMRVEVHRKESSHNALFRTMQSYGKVQKQRSFYMYNENEDTCVLAPASTRAKQKTLLGGVQLFPAQRKRIKDYIQRSWHDLIEADQPASGVLQRAKNINMSGNSSSAGKFHETSLSKSHSMATISKKETGTSSTKYLSKETSPSVAKPGTKRPNLRAIVQRELDNQVTRRIESSLEAAKRMETTRELMQARQARMAADMAQAQAKLSALEQKCSEEGGNEDGDSERGQDDGGSPVQQKSYSLSRLLIVSETKGKAQLFATVTNLKREARYMKKAEKIAESKRLKARTIVEVKKTIQQKLDRQKQKQAELLDQHKRAQDQAVSNLEKMLKLKDLQGEKNRSEIQAELTEEKGYWEEMGRLNGILREENKARLERMQEYRRNQVLDLQASLSAKHSAERRMFQTYQCSLRAQAVKERVQQEEACERLEGMLRVPGKKAAREKMVGVFRSLNDSLGLGLSLKQGKERKEKKPEDSDEENSMA